MAAGGGSAVFSDSDRGNRIGKKAGTAITMEEQRRSGAHGERQAGEPEVFVDQSESSSDISNPSI